MWIGDHRFEAAVVARTLWSRGISGEGLAVSGKQGQLRIETLSLKEDRPLFALQQEKAGEISVLRGLEQVLEFSKETLEATEPDPLWESAHGICSHMEKDHRDTFSSFLLWRGWRGGSGMEISMPWVDKDGFVLALSGPQTDFVWVPFLQESPTPNEVRKSMIKMLKVIRNEE